MGLFGPGSGGNVSQQGSSVQDRVLVILNPAARHGMAGRLRPALAREVEARPRWSMVVTSGPSEAASYASSTEDIDVILAVGGDGTVHEIVNGIMARAAGDRPLLAIVPSGSGDDYATMLGLPSSVPDCLAILDERNSRCLDVGCCNGTYFMNSLSIGLDARVTARVTQLQETTIQTGLCLLYTSPSPRD